MSDEVAYSNRMETSSQTLYVPIEPQITLSVQTCTRTMLLLELKRKHNAGDRCGWETIHPPSRHGGLPLVSSSIQPDAALDKNTGTWREAANPLRHIPL